MDLSILKTLGAVAGIGGLSLGVVLLVFRNVIRKSIFPQLGQNEAFKLLRLIVVLTFLIGAAGLTAWVFTTKAPPSSGPSPTKHSFHVVSAPNMAVVYDISGTYQTYPGKVIIMVASGKMSLWKDYNNAQQMTMQTVQFGVCSATPEGSWSIYPVDRTSATSIPLLGVTLEKGPQYDIPAATVQVPLPITHENDDYWVCTQVWTQVQSNIPGHDESKANILAQ